MRISVIIPTWNEAHCIESCLQGLQTLREQQHEIILVDGGSEDDTIARADPWVDQVLMAPRGRARQLRAGAQAARGELLWFVHADTEVPENAAQQMLIALRQHGAGWGRFAVRLSGQGWRFRVIEALMNLRSCVTGIATGDQGIFVRRDWYEAVGGWPDIPLMEDVALSRGLKHLDRPLCLSTRLGTSSRRWERHGVWRTVLLMWWLRLAYALGVNPRRLATRYAAR